MTNNRRSRLLTNEIALLREAARAIRPTHPFHIDAWVILPGLMHCLCDPSAILEPAQRSLDEMPLVIPLIIKSERLLRLLLLGMLDLLPLALSSLRNVALS
jgi:hypothetical protein